MADFYQWSGATALEASFWGTPLGLFTLWAILFGSVHHLFCKTVEDGLFDRLYYWACAMCSAATLYQIYQGAVPQNVAKTLMVALAVRYIIVVIDHHYEQYKGKKRRRPHI